MSTMSKTNETAPPVRFGYINDLTATGLSDSLTDEEHQSWIQAFPVGKWTHPTYGDIEMTLEKAVSMAANVNAGVRGQDLDIDYDHKEVRQDAAGWVQKAEAREDGLWLFIDWTKEAVQKIKDKAYRYFSPEFADEWEHTASGQKFKNVLFGGALTNRPHLKGILPINLSEYEEKTTEDEGKKSNRDLLEALANLYGVQFDENTLDENLSKAIAKVVANMKKQKSKKKKNKHTEPNLKTEPVAGSLIRDLKEEDWSQFSLTPNVDTKES